LTPAEIGRQAGSQSDLLAVDAFLAEEAALREMVQTKCGNMERPI